MTYSKVIDRFPSNILSPRKTETKFHRRKFALTQLDILNKVTCKLKNSARQSSDVISATPWLKTYKKT